MSKKLIILVSVILALVAETFLIYILYFNSNTLEPLMDPKIWPWFSALFNSLSATCLALAFLFIRHQKIKQHIIFIHLALLFSAAFLVNYILYHLSVGHVQFNYAPLRTYYLILLIVHLLTSIITLPMIFASYLLGINQKLVEHKKLALMTFYLWEFVSVSGVAIVVISQLFK